MDLEKGEQAKLESIEEMIQAVVAVLEEKKGNDIETLNVTEKTTLADQFVLASGTSNVHIKTLAESVEEKMKDAFGIHPDRVEGMDSRSWILLDYGDIVVHIMMPEDRLHYQLESLWRSGGERRPI
ncbi:MAG: ribosome silencing factor [Clostridiales bacterium]|nr:ribosome silencing factor [Clostridiales bacterium]MDY0119403.1 ribosome silencing factor [Clostridia bacterium]